MPGQLTSKPGTLCEVSGELLTIPLSLLGCNQRVDSLNAQLCEARKHLAESLAATERLEQINSKGREEAEDFEARIEDLRYQLQTAKTDHRRLSDRHKRASDKAQRLSEENDEHSVQVSKLSVQVAQLTHSLAEQQYTPPPVFTPPTLEELCCLLLPPEERDMSFDVNELGRKSDTVSQMGQRRRQQLAQIGTKILWAVLSLLKAGAPDPSGVLDVVEGSREFQRLYTGECHLFPQLISALMSGTPVDGEVHPAEKVLIESWRTAHQRRDKETARQLLSIVSQLYPKQRIINMFSSDTRSCTLYQVTEAAKDARQVLFARTVLCVRD